MTPIIDNKYIAAQIALLAKLLELHGDNPFKIKNYTYAAQLIKKYPEDLAAMNEDDLKRIKGIGNATTAKIWELVQTGKINELELQLEKTPAGVVEMFQVKGLGAKKVAALWKEMGIESIGELEYACTENRLINFKGFGAKTQESILKNIAFIKNNTGYYLWADALAIKRNSENILQQHFPDFTFAITGDFLQQQTTLNALVWITDCTLAQIQSLFAEIAEEQILSTIEDNTLTLTFPDTITHQFKHTLKDNISRAVFELSGSEIFIKTFTDKYAIDNISNEEEIFQKHQLIYIPPAIRYDVAIIEKAANNNLSQLIQLQDIKGVIHCHTTYSDGVNTLEEMAREAIKRGYEYIVITDHSQSAGYAGGLKLENILQQHEEIDRLNQQLQPFKIFKSIESDIWNDGSLDYPDEVLALFDLVIASVHSNLNMTQEKAMQRVLTAIRNPYTTILGHSSGRLLHSREGYPLDYPTLIEECAAHNVVIEINAHPRRLDIDWQWLPLAVSKNVLLSINPDAHSVAGIDVLQFGVAAAQKGCLTARHNLSSFSLVELEKFLEQQKQK